jgi:hypothetical protein
MYIFVYRTRDWLVGGINTVCCTGQVRVPCGGPLQVVSQIELCYGDVVGAYAP